MIELGIHYGVSEAVYHSDPAPRPSLSSTLARLLLSRSPRHAWHASPRLNPGWAPTAKEAFDFGSAAHTAILTRGAALHIVDAADWRGKDARAERDAAREAGKTPLLAHQWEAVRACEAAVRQKLARLRLGHVFADAERAEVVALAEIEGTICRAMVDFVGPDGWLYDLKTTVDASPEAIRRSVEGYGYHVQAAHYLDTWRAAGGDARGLRFVFVEKSPPHEVSVVELTDDAADPSDWGEMAREQCADARRIWRECLEAGHWPGLPDAIMTIGAPVWTADKWADRRQVVQAQAPKKPSRDRLAAAAAWQAP